ncbi:MAG TPA: S1-like domain-containing RNA-binding protein [Spirochaetia bacterium]|nr:S1-like domain-containing RNA-binding protein [Spirochaetia bacterium]
MLITGDFNTLTVRGKAGGGLLLVSDDGKEVRLPKRDTPKHIEIGDQIEAFVYADSDGSLYATLDSPKAKRGEFAWLQVKDVTNFGAFLDWGIGKDLFVPSGMMHEPMVKGKYYIVYISADPRSGSVIGCSSYSPFIKKDVSGLKPGKKVHYLVYRSTELGFSVIVDNAYLGLIYRSEAGRELQVGESGEAYIKKVREDGKLDISLQKIGFDALVDGKKRLAAALESHGGFLPLTDNSSKEEIARELGMSKNLFKRAAGVLFREGVVSLDADGIRLI